MNLIYHDVAESGGSPRFRVSPALFRRHLEAIAAAGARVATLEDAPAARVVRLTFDDGDASAVSFVAPALAAYGWKAHFFIITDRIGRRGSLDADEVRALRAAGHVVGSHGQTHRPLAELGADELRGELERSKAALEEVLEEPVEPLSAPRGSWSPGVAVAAAAAGYRELFVSDPRLRPQDRDGLRVHGRFSVIADTPPRRVEALCSFSRAVVAREVAVWRGRNTVKRALGPVYSRARDRVVARRHA